MRIPQPFQYQGSKRGLASEILHYFPQEPARLVEPFAGSAAISIAAAVRSKVKAFWLNDCNAPLANLLEVIICQPLELAKAYERIWREQEPDTIQHYNRVRDEFNLNQDPKLFLYLLARCVKGAVRYNSEGLFNQSPDKRRRGTRPETMRHNIITVSQLLRGRTQVTARDYREVLEEVREDDVVYMDPPYQGVCGERDSRYFSGILFEEFVAALESLNKRHIRYLISYDGRTGGRTYGKPLPKNLHLQHIELEAGRSSQATLLGRDDVTYESLYLSASLAEEIAANRQEPIPRALEQHSFL